MCISDNTEICLFVHIMNHDSGFIIGIAVEFLKILIGQSPKTSLRKQTRAKNNTQKAYYTGLRQMVI